MNLPCASALAVLPCTAKYKVLLTSDFCLVFWTAGSFRAGLLRHSRDPIPSPSLRSFPAAVQPFLCLELAEIIWSLINSTNSKLIQ